MKPVSEEDLINDDAEQFDLTQIDLQGNEEENKKAMIGDETQPQEIKAVEEPVQEENRQDGFRLDQLSKDRTGNKLRMNLLSKLSYEKIWLTPQEKPKAYETAIIFDWDDTLLCTSFINPSGVYQHVELGTVVQQHIKLLEQTSTKMLELAV